MVNPPSYRMMDALDPNHPNQRNPYPGRSNGVFQEDEPTGLDQGSAKANIIQNQNDQDVVESELLGSFQLSGEDQDLIDGPGIYQDLPMSMGTSPPQQYALPRAQQLPQQAQQVEGQYNSGQQTSAGVMQQQQQLSLEQQLQQRLQAQQQLKSTPAIRPPTPAVAQASQWLQVPAQSQTQTQQAVPRLQAHPEAQSQPLSQPQSQQSREPVPPVPVSEYDQLLMSLKKHPHSSGNWNRLIDVAEQSKDMEKIKTAYESLLQVYPNTVRNSPLDDYLPFSNFTPFLPSRPSSLLNTSEGYLPSEDSASYTITIARRSSDICIHNEGLSLSGGNGPCGPLLGVPFLA